jgi:hypothetical protein
MLPIDEAAAVLKPAAIRYLRAVRYGTPRAADLRYVVEAEETDGVGDLLAVGVLTPRAEAVLNHQDGYDGDAAEAVREAEAAVGRARALAFQVVRSWGDVQYAHYAPTLEHDGISFVWEVRTNVGRRTLIVLMARNGRAHCDLREYVHGREARLCPIVSASSGNNLAEALHDLGAPDQARRS